MFELGKISETRSDGHTDAEVLQAAHRLVEIYLVYLRQHETGNDLFDARELPALKEALVNAFRVVIATESRPKVRALLVKAGMTLAQFQENIGRPMIIRPILPASARRRDAADRQDVMTLRRFDHALLRLGEERVRLGHVFQSAINIAENRAIPQG